MSTEYKSNIESEKEIDFKYKSLQKKLLVKKITYRLLVTVILFCLIYFFFIYKRQSKPVTQNISEAPNTEDVVIEDSEIEPTGPETKAKDLLKIPEVSPVIEPTESSTKKNPNNNLYSLTPLRFEGTIAGQGNDLIFYSCLENEALLILPSSPYYNYIYNKYNTLRIGTSIYGKIPVIFMGRKVPVEYQGLGSIYRQGFYIDAVLDIDSRSICT